MDIRVTPKHTLAGKPFALVRFTRPGQRPQFKTVLLTPEAMDTWDDQVTAFLLPRVGCGAEWQGCLWW